MKIYDAILDRILPGDYIYLVKDKCIICMTPTLINGDIYLRSNDISLDLNSFRNEYLSEGEFTIVKVKTLNGECIYNIK